MLILKKLLLGFVVAGLCSASLEAAVLTGVDPTIINVGSGPNISYLVIDESTLYTTPLEFVYHYTYNSNNPVTGNDLMSAITNSTSLNFMTGSFGELESISYGSKTVAGTPFDPDNTSGFYWSYYVAGGVEDDGSSTIPSTNTWTYADVGFNSRFITPGSWDGQTFASYVGALSVDVPPSVAVAAVPEPATLPLTLLCLATLVALLRWKSSDRNSTR